MVVCCVVRLCFCRYWHYLQRVLEPVVVQLLDRQRGFGLRVVQAFNARATEMDVPLLKLALFLDPKYRRAAIRMSVSNVSPRTNSGGSSGGDSGSGGDGSASGGSSGGGSGSGSAPDDATTGIAALQTEAGKLAQKLGYSQDDVLQLYVLMDMYAYNRPPFNKSQLAPRAYWVAVVGSPATAGGTAAAAERPELLANIALRLLETKPTATSIEQVG